MKITEDFIGNETKALTKTKISTILRWWGFDPDSYSTWGNARSDMNNILSGSPSSTISDRERASSFLSKINYINDTDTVIGGMLFAANEPGVWYDPSDLSTLYQDSAGTTPVTAVEQPVGLMLDKSKGLVMGPELVPQPLNVSTTPWSATSAVTSRTQNSFTTSDTGGIILEGLSTTKTYEIRIAGTTSLPLLVRNPDTLDGHYVIPEGAFDVTIRSPAMFSVTPRLYLSLWGAGTATISNISIRELPGNHAYQTTTTSRPVLSARYNLLDKTDQLNDPSWEGAGVYTHTANQLAPDGSLTASKFTSNGVAAVTHKSLTAQATALKYSIYLKSGTHVPSALFRNNTTSNNLVGTTSDEVSGSNAYGSWTVESLADGWKKITINITSGVSVGDTIFVYIGAIAAVPTGKYWYVWRPDLRVANDGINLPPYQRVNTATDYDTVGFPPYLKFDGVDDWLVTNTITPNTDKAQVFAGLRKLSDAAIGMVIETSADAVTNNGAISLRAPWGDASTTYQYLSRGTVFSSVVLATVAAPRTDVLTGTSDISGDSVVFRVNGIQAGTSNVDQGASNYLAYPIFIGRRGGTALSFNGHLYSLIVRFGPNLPIETIEKTEKYINGLTKAY